MQREARLMIWSHAAFSFEIFGFLLNFSIVHSA